MSEKAKKTILIADDVKINRDILVHALKDEYDILEASDGAQTIQVIAENYKKLSVVLLDINMPRINGFQVMHVLNKKNAMKYLPIILITGDQSIENMRKGYEYGAVEFVKKPFDVEAVKRCIKNVVKLYSEKNRLEMLTIQQNKLLLEKTERLRQMNMNMMDMIGTLVEFRDSEDNKHIKRVKAFTRSLCKTASANFPEYELDDTAIDKIVTAASLHDIGKIMIKDSILLKPSKLTPDEYEIIKSHTTKGCELLNALSEFQDEEDYKYCYEVCRSHHERHDGSGYPDNLKGDEIPISAQIVSIAEAFDALMINKIYKAPIDFEKAFNMILEGECGAFSPHLLHCFSLNKEAFADINKKYS